MAVNLTKLNKDYALYLPSISSFYAKFASEYYTLDKSPRQGVHPKGVPSFSELDFLDESKGLFFYKHALYSAGHAALDPARSDIVESMVMKRDRSKTWILGDSGGYQVSTGVLKFPWDKPIDGPEANAVKDKIQNWLEYSSDYSMLFDFPTSSIDNPKSPITSFKQCLDESLINFDYFLRNRQGKTKYLNVIQGRTLHESTTWFNEIKDLPFEGWAFAGAHNNDFEMILTRIIEMRDGHYFEENSQGDKRNWLHFLGQSRLMPACAFTHIQRKLREQLSDDELHVSFDSASPFLAVANGQVYTQDIFTPKRFSYIMEKAYDDKALVGSDLPFPWRSEIGDRLTMGDLCVRSDKWAEDNDRKWAKTSWDSYSYALLMGHNLERQIRATQIANNIYDLSDSNSDYMPIRLVEFKDVVNRVFASETPLDEIKKNHKLLNKLGGRNMGKGVSVSNDILSSMFNTEIPPEADDETALNALEAGTDKGV